MQLLGNDLGRLQPAEPILTVRNYNPVSVRGQSSVPEFAQHPAICFLRDTIGIYHTTVEP